MTLTFHYHPLASFCHKALIALYENDTPFEPVVINFGSEKSAADFKALWPLGKMPVLVDSARGHTVGEASAVVDYLDARLPEGKRIVPNDAELGWQARMWDSIFDSYVHEPMQRIVYDRLRPAERRDADTVDQAKGQIRQAYAFIEQSLSGRTWALGETFSLADCAAAPALFYADTIVPFAPNQAWLADYLERLMRRPSYARVLREAEPYFGNFPMDDKPLIEGRAAERKRRGIN